MQDRRQAVQSALRGRGARERLSNGELWVDHHCLFHEDRHRSATYQPDTGVYHCRTEGVTYPLEEVESRLLIQPRTNQVWTKPDIRKEIRRLVYTYYWPEGEPSHIKERIEYEDGSKSFRQLAPNGKPGLPDDNWPIYGDTGIEESSYILVVEGEKCVDGVYAMDDSRGRPIVALTAGSSGDNRKHAVTIATRLADLKPMGVIIWPDNDDPGFTWAEAVSRACKKVGVNAGMLKPAEWNIPLKGDVIDYLEQTGSLAVLVDKICPPVKITQTMVQLTADRIMVVSPKLFVFPGTRRTGSIELSYVKAAWLSMHGRMPAADQAQELLVRLQRRGFENPTRARYRVHSTDNEFWWRPAPIGPCYRVSEFGVEQTDDPDGELLLVPDVEPMFESEVDLSGSQDDFRQLCSAYSINDHELAMLESWLVLAFCGLQTPIMLMRGAAATGKSTFARLILGVIEPVGIEIDASKQMQTDPREFLRLLQTSPALLIDNVTTLGVHLEDVLSKLVTGYTTALRTLYADLVETLRFQRAVMITTTNWDVYKGDLASRIIVCQPKTRTDAWMSDRDAKRIFGEMLPRIRGYILKRCVQYYQRRKQYQDIRSSWRVGDMGVVLSCLDFDSEVLAGQERLAKAEVINQNDPWLDAMVDLWKQVKPIAPHVLSSADIAKHMLAFGVEDPPTAGSSKLTRWVEEKGFIFRDHGFRMVRFRSARIRGYRFEYAMDDTLPVQPSLNGHSAKVQEEMYEVEPDR